MCLSICLPSLTYKHRFILFVYALILRNTRYSRFKQFLFRFNPLLSRSLLANVFDKNVHYCLHSTEVNIAWTCWICNVSDCFFFLFSFRFAFGFGAPRVQNIFYSTLLFCVYRCSMISETFSIKYNWFRIHNWPKTNRTDIFYA